MTEAKILIIHYPIDGPLLEYKPAIFSQNHLFGWTSTRRTSKVVPQDPGPRIPILARTIGRPGPMQILDGGSNQKQEKGKWSSGPAGPESRWVYWQGPVTDCPALAAVIGSRVRSKSAGCDRTRKNLEGDDARGWTLGSKRGEWGSTTNLQPLWTLQTIIQDAPNKSISSWIPCHNRFHVTEVRRVILIYSRTQD
jgi:hypothetical protein